MKKILKNLDMIFCGITLMLIILMTFINVICRYIFGFFIAPFEEISLILFVWFCYVGASISFKNRNHIAIDSFYNLLPDSAKKVIDIIIDLVQLVVCIYMTKLAFSLCINAKHKVTLSLRLPFVIYDAALLFSFFIMSLYSVLLLVKTIKNMKKSPED